MKSLLAKSKKMKNKKGFTLIELIVVIVIIGILAAIILPNFISFTDTAKEQAAVGDARSILNALYALDAEGTPAAVAAVETYTGALDGTLTIVDYANFTYVTADGYSVTVTAGDIGDPVAP